MGSPDACQSLDLVGSSRPTGDGHALPIIGAGVLLLDDRRSKQGRFGLGFIVPLRWLLAEGHGL